jgi:hypothetical protein
MVAGSRWANNLLTECSWRSGSMSRQPQAETIVNDVFGSSGIALWRIAMSKRVLTLASLLPVLLLGCATNNDREVDGPAIAKTAVAAGSVFTGGLTPKVCEDSMPGDAREACLARVREVNGVELKAKTKIDDFQTYRAKRDSDAE